MWNELAETMAMAMLDVLFEAPRIADDGVSTIGAIFKLIFLNHVHSVGTLNLVIFRIPCRGWGRECAITMESIVN
jgi:hypothetical protein